MDKFKQTAARAMGGVRSWFGGCYGADALGVCIVSAALLCILLGFGFGIGLIVLAGVGLYIWAMARMLSHNPTKRRAENEKLTRRLSKTKTETSQAMVRLRNQRTYKYFKCPGCGTRLRMPRGIGEKTVTCSQCKTAFKQKA